MAFNDLRTRKEVESSAVTERVCVAEKVKGCLQEERDEKKKQAGKKRKFYSVREFNIPSLLTNRELYTPDPDHCNPVLLRAFPLETRFAGNSFYEPGRKRKVKDPLDARPFAVGLSIRLH
ncbi:uncharacterized protein RAG0_03621 [Rhynchosporium agropyri]|uniref:Uncharacterized protein n=1 Tax=Rhynchosporium agropyri TaxID=914238 RepID=A0A1E1K5S5_9HELO|nr:uncharacterized protein RAG0_03621 [Rhynchosporium agropyri]